MEGLGRIEADFREHVIWVKLKGEKVEVRGNPNLSRTVASLKAMIRELNRATEAYYIELGMTTMHSQEIKGNVEGLEATLEEYSDLFKEASELPPSRRCDHAIVINEGAQIPNIQPYRYPHHEGSH